MSRISLDAYRDAMEIVGLIEIFRAGNDSATTKAVNRARAGSTLTQIYISIFWRTSILVVRAYDVPRATDLTLSRAFKILEDNQVRQHVAHKGNGELLTKAISLWDKLRSDHRLPILKHSRNKYLAHWGEPNEDTPKPTIKELFDFAHETAELMQVLVNATGATNDTLERHKTDFKKSAENFWAPWNKTKPTE